MIEKLEKIETLIECLNNPIKISNSDIKLAKGGNPIFARLKIKKKRLKRGIVTIKPR